MGRWRARALYTALGLAALLVVILARQNRVLREKYASQVAAATMARPGFYVPTFRAATLDGRVVTIGAPSGGRQLLFFFTTTCPFCEESWPALHNVARRLEGHSAYAVSLSGPAATRSYADRHAIPLGVAMLPEAKLRLLYRARSVPTVLVLDSLGQVTYARVGVLKSQPATDSIVAAMSAPSDSPSP